MTSSKQDQDFLKSVMPLSLLEEAISWISKNLEIQDVFDESEIIRWIENNDYIHISKINEK